MTELPDVPGVFVAESFSLRDVRETFTFLSENGLGSRGAQCTLTLPRTFVARFQESS